MKQYWVSIPASARVDVLVEAETEEGAKEKAFDVDFTISLEGKDAELSEFELHDRIVNGNVCYAVHWEIEAEEA